MSIELEDDFSNDEELNFYSELTIFSDDSKIINAAYQAILPETIIVITPRGKTSIEMKNDSTLMLKFFAADFISLRAMIGSYLRWIDAALSTIMTK
ncbi:MAG: hypothetical protein JXA54_00990 [Candidatus Heimdallarchaeota archaeon]|nr:hypothetical protein [Candidatus Heimdallarchaeota archaeon]